MNADSKVRSFYEVTALTPDQVAAAYPLVRHHADHIDLDAWRDFATPLVDGIPADRRPSTGIVMATRRGAARGLFVYMRLPHLEFGWILLVPHAFCTEMLRTAPLWALLLGEMTAIAEDLGCGMIRLIVHPPWGELSAAVGARGSGYIPVELLQTHAAFAGGSRG